MKKIIALLLGIALASAPSYSQNHHTTQDDAIAERISADKFSVSTTWLSFLNFGHERTNTHHYEIRIGYQLTPNDKIGIKVTTWKLFAPMGIPFGDAIKMNENTFFPGKLDEKGIGVTYQRLLWKGLFATIEILPLKKTYFDDNNKKIGHGFKLFTSYHLGYHIPLFNNRMFIEPQIHSNHWPIDAKAPHSFQVEENKWNNYMLFEPNIYIGVNF